ncbi:uncharacterized protein LOC108629336 [Ceratina calcarata]|uniref:Uncharacterized protein LOC108629336 n=1 Tax=Ceratina calcarata TaxID=156304 RepID=A0AAJ7S7Z3_9HYME|nr:uncharacterized protein LOC108629336 [Ceratina calcarata]
MRLFVLILAIAMVTTCHAIDLKVFLEKFRKTLQTGDSKLGIPVLDPYHLRYTYVNIYKEGLVKMKGDLENVNAIGFSDYKPVRGDFTLIGLKVKLELLWEEMKLSSNYALEGVLGGDIQFHGVGNIDAVLKNLTVSAELSLKVNSTTDHLYVKDSKVNAYLDKLDFWITGLYDDPELSKTLSKVISDIVPGLVNDYQDQISQTASPIVGDILNNGLKGLTLTDLINIITGNSLSRTDSSK